MLSTVGSFLLFVGLCVLCIVKFAVSVKIRRRLDCTVESRLGFYVVHVRKSATEYALSCYVPIEDEAAEFDRIARPIDERIAVTSADSIRLATLRDTLLPQLMSGEIAPPVSCADIPL